MRSISTLSFLAALLVIAAGSRDVGKPPLLKNPGFENDALGKAPADWHFPDVCAKAGYALVVSNAKPYAGKQCAVLKRSTTGESEAFGNILQLIDAAPFRGQRVRFKAAVRADVEEGGQAMMWLRVDRANEAMGFFDNMMDRPIRANTWKHYEIIGDVADDAQSIVLGMMLFGNGEAAFDDASFEIADKATVKVTGVANINPPAPGLVEAVMAHDLHASADTKDTTLLYPLPLAYRDQVPLTFHLQVDPPEAAKEVAIVSGPDENRTLKLSLINLDRSKKTTVTYRSLILIGPTDFADVPKTATYPETWPVEVQPWLTATWCADSDNDRIKKLADELRGDSTNVIEVLNKVVARSNQIIGNAQGRVNDLTAVEALDKQGSCTSCANLVAALLRGAGIPARILAGYPLWSGPLQTHYIVEAYLPGYGWYPIESTMGKAPWPNHQQVAVSIVPIANESHEKAGRRTFAAGAVPYLSLTECDGKKAGLGSVGTLKQYCDHEARMVRPMTAQPAEWSGTLGWAKPRWEAWTKSRPEIIAGKLTYGPDTGAVNASNLASLCSELK